MNPEFSNIRWTKSSHSQQATDQCVEVAAVQHFHLTRDSKDPLGPILVMPSVTWAALLTDIKRGAHDL
ncbi:DUF397 domain-containing protein [Spirillospora sp. CA-253888]